MSKKTVRAGVIGGKVADGHSTTIEPVRKLLKHLIKLEDVKSIHPKCITAGVRGSVWRLKCTAQTWGVLLDVVGCGCKQQVLLMIEAGSCEAIIKEVERIFKEEVCR